MSKAFQTSSEQVTMSSYIIGFVLSVILTSVAYLTVTKQLYSGTTLIAIIITLAVAQVLVQLVFFLHLGRESKPRWKLWVFLFMLLVLGILVGGSLWIMQNLNYHMDSVDMNNDIIKDEGIHY